MGNNHTKRATCSFCLKVADVPKGDNICAPCDRELATKSEALEKAQKVSHRKCRSCRHTLPKSRYFECLRCNPMLESDDGDFNYFEAPDGQGYTRRNFRLVDEKQCTKCRFTKPTEEFSRRFKSLDGYDSHCLSCKVASNARRKEAKQNELPAVH